jgi:hypothetical protein
MRVVIRLVQLVRIPHERRVAVVENDTLRLLRFPSVYDCALHSLMEASTLEHTVARDATKDTLSYDEVYEGRTEWRFLPAFDHPAEPARCLVSGTGLTHLASAQNRQAMHSSAADLTDSMRMYLWGVEGGRPADGEIGVAPEWFYKGSGTILRGHGEALVRPNYAGDGGEEPEIAGAYIIDFEGRPRRVGLMTANEFSDHVTEKKNYLYLAPSKLRTCSIGPELVCGASFDSVPGQVRILRGADEVWSKEIRTGEANMSHTLANIEHHHFKFEQHRRPGDVHIHFLGAGAFSYGAGVALQNGDVMEISFTGFGRPLRNPLLVEEGKPDYVRVADL